MKSVMNHFSKLISSLRELCCKTAHVGAEGEGTQEISESKVCVFEHFKKTTEESSIAILEVL
jgi:hypothetical protein